MWNDKRVDRVEMPRQPEMPRQLRLDPAMGKRIRERAKLNRRSIQQEILVLLENSLLRTESEETGVFPIRVRVTPNGTAEVVAPEGCEPLAQSGDDTEIFEPYFETREIASEIRRNQTVPRQRMFRECFEEFGCSICATKDRPHAGLAMCTHCHRMLAARFQGVLRSMEKKRPDSGSFTPDRLTELARASVRDHTDLARAAVRAELRKIVSD